jgi:hypothetical protein
MAFPSLSFLVFRVAAGTTTFAGVAILAWAARRLFGGPALGVGLVVAAVVGITTTAAFRRMLERCSDSVRWDRVMSVVFFPAALLAAPFFPLDEWLERLRWPRTVEEAADRLISDLNAKSRRRLRELREDELALLHFDLGMGIRNSFGLWQGNEELLRDCGAEDKPVPADYASGVILARLLERLRDSGR